MNISDWIIKYRKELEFKNYSKSSIELYVNVVYSFLKDFDGTFTSPDRIKTEIIKDWIKQAPSISTMKIRIGALKNFYLRTVRQPLKFDYVEYPKSEKKHHVILSNEEMQRLIDSCENIKHKTIIVLAYSTGVRVSELLNIRLKDIDRANMVIHILNGKGNKSRQVTMKPQLLSLIEKYYIKYRPNEFLFEGQYGSTYTSSSINQFLKKYATLAGIKKNVHIHLIRHQFASNSLEHGENLHVTQKALGHASPKTTADIYYHISPQIIANAYSPIQNIRL